VKVSIVTPQRKLVEDVEATDVTFQAAKGQLQILPGHTELLTTLDTGLLSFVSGGEKRRFAVSYGFAEVKDDHVLFLAETCEESSEIDVDRAKEAQRLAWKYLTEGITDPEEFKKIQLKHERAVLRQEVAE